MSLYVSLNAQHIALLSECNVLFFAAYVREYVQEGDGEPSNSLISLVPLARTAQRVRVILFWPRKFISLTVFLSAAAALMLARLIPAAAEQSSASVLLWISE